MTSIQIAQIVGKSDALEVARKITDIFENSPRKPRNPTEYERVRQMVENVMLNTMAILSTADEYERLFRERENREAYYRSFEYHMRLTGIVGENFTYAPERQRHTVKPMNPQSVPR